MNSRTQTLLNALNPDNVREFAYEYSRQNCVHLKKIRFRSAYSGDMREIYVPCGKCRVCRSYRIKEWVSRMSLHTQYCRKYVYFVTLTYKPFIFYKNIPNCLIDAYWRVDNLNKTHHKCYSPCILRHEHFQRFIRNLRKSLGSDTCDFFMCGEYGDTYGRPHFHSLIWSDVPISTQMFRNAWRVNISKSTKYPKFVSIGDCRVDDLQENGTLTNNGCNAFRYVAKYCVKSSYLNKKDAGRLGLFVTDLRDGKVSRDQLNVIFNKRVRTLQPLLLNFATYVAPIFRDIERNEFNEVCKLSPFAQFYAKFFDLINPDNIKNVSPDTSYLFLKLKDFFTDENVSQILMDYYRSQLGLQTLRQVFAPYVQSSNRRPIGKEYAIAHLNDFTIGNRQFPQSCGASLVFPRYFERLVQQKVRCYDVLRTSLSCAHVKTTIFSNEIDNGDFVSKIANKTPDICGIAQAFCPFGYGNSSLSISEYIANKDYVIKDNVRNLFIVPYLCPDSLSFRSYRYDRHSRDYQFVDEIYLSEFLPLLLKSVLDYRRYIQALDIRINSYVTEIDNLYRKLSNVCKDFNVLLSDAELEHEYISDTLFHQYKSMQPNQPLNE